MPATEQFAYYVQDAIRVIEASEDKSLLGLRLRGMYFRRHY